jgi:hypothetical protein
MTDTKFWIYFSFFRINRFELVHDITTWGLPFSFSHGIGGHTFRFFCLEFVYWHGRFSKPDPIHDPRHILGKVF